MKSFDGFKPEAPVQSMPMLPAGAYAAVIMDVRLEGEDPDLTLVLRLDITEGEWAGYYARRYQQDDDRFRGGGRYEPKYKGVFRLRVPNPDNPKSQHPEWDLRAFNSAIWAVEQSNPGYRWDWNEAGLKGRRVGMNVREAVYRDCTYSEIGRLEDINAVRAGKVNPMRPRVSAPSVSAPAPAGFTPAEDEELTF